MKKCIPEIAYRTSNSDAVSSDGLEEIIAWGQFILHNISFSQGFVFDLIVLLILSSLFFLRLSK